MSSLQSIRRLLEARPDVRLAYLFGSAARGEERPRSDLDVGVLFEDDPAPEAINRLVAELERAVGRPVDLVVLGTAPPLLAHEVISRGTLLVCRDEDDRVRFAARTVARYLDTAPLRAVQHAYLRERAEARRARSG